MPEWITQAGEVAKWVASVGGALAVIWAWFAKPLRDMKKDISTFKEDTKDQMTVIRENVETVQGMTDFLIGDRLAQAYTYWMRKQYCPPVDKKRLSTMYDIYHKRGLNTLEDQYRDNLMALPEEPAGR